MKILWHMPTLRRRTCGLSQRALRFASYLLTLGHDVEFAVENACTDIAEGNIAGIPLRRLYLDRKTPLHWSLQARTRNDSAQVLAQQMGDDFDLFISCQPEMIDAFSKYTQKSRLIRPPILFVCGGTALLHDNAEKWEQSEQSVLSRMSFALDRHLRHQNEAAAFRAADRIVFNSSTTMQRVVSSYFIDPRKCTPICGGMDPNRHVPPTPYERFAARNRLRISEKQSVVVWTGRLSPEKNVQMLINAMPQVQASNVLLLLVGDGPARPHLEDLARQNGVSQAVRFIGDQTDVTPFLFAADAFVFPSRGESFGCALVEAMACGLPCIALRSSRVIQTAAEEIFDSGRCGFLVSTPEPKELAGVIDKVFAEPETARQMGQAAAKFVARRFSWAQAEDRFSQVVAQMTGTIGRHREEPLSADRRALSFVGAS